MNAKDDSIILTQDSMSNGATWSLEQYWSLFLYQYGLPVVQFLINLLYGVYVHFTIINTVIFLLKYIPTAIYVYTMIKQIYLTSKQRIKEKQIELEDLQLQVEIMNTKLSIREAEFNERAKELQRCTERLRRLQARVRQLLANDDVLRRFLETLQPWGTEQDIIMDTVSSDDHQVTMKLLKELKCDPISIPERQSVKMDCGEYATYELRSPDDSIYSTMSDIDMGQECRVKIVKVTNVYKIACLKHFIRQKSLRRASKQARMKQKMENINKLLEDWQKKLNKVINNKLTILNIDRHPLDLASREARGDYSKIAESSDSDSDLRNNTSDVYQDEFNNLGWAQDPYKPSAFSYEYIPETAAVSEVKREYYSDVKYHNNAQYEYSTNMFSITEETNSQIAIEDIKSETEFEPDCSDFVAI